MSKEEKSNIGAIFGFIIFILIIVVGIAFAYVNGLLGISPDANDIMGTVSSKLSDQAKLITKSNEIEFQYDTGKDYKTIGDTNIKIPFTAKSIKINYKYTVNAGIKDLSLAEYESNGDTLIIKLPKAEILNDDSDIGTYDYAETNENPLNQLKMEDINNLLKLLKEKAIQKSIDQGILSQAENHTEELLNQMFSDILGNTYKIKVEWK